MLLTGVSVSATPRGVGRPPLKTTSITKPTTIRLTEDVRLRIEALVGEKSIAEFIREAVEAELKRREKLASKI